MATGVLEKAEMVRWNAKLLAEGCDRKRSGGLRVSTLETTDGSSMWY